MIPVHDAVAATLARLAAGSRSHAGSHLHAGSRGAAGSRLEAEPAPGLGCVFGLLGSGNFHVSNALQEEGFRFITTRHEAGAVTAADAYARVTGTVGLCTVHQGPGLTNAMTGLAEAAKGRTPLLLLAADTGAAAVHSNFRIDQAQLVTSVGAVAERLHTPQSAVADTVRAWHRCRTEGKPVVLMMPLDVQKELVPAPGDLPALPAVRPMQPATDAVAEVVALLAQARRPLIVAGRGAVLAGAGELLQQLADRTGALLATSAQAKGLFSDSPWDLGIMGGFSSPTAARLIGQADLVLTFGASLNMWTTRHGRLFAPEAVIVQVDDEPQAFGKHYRVDVAVAGDVAATATALLAEIDSRGLEPAPQRTPDLQELIHNGRWQRAAYEAADTDSHIDPRTLSIALNEMLPPDRAVAIDSGHFMGYPAMYLDVPDAQGFVFTQGFQSVGLGLASAIGAAVAMPDRLTVAALGDGGAFMGAADLETVVRLGLRILIVIYNDAAYGAEVHHFGPHGAPLDLVRFPDFDFAALGRAVGMAAATVRRREDLAAVQDWVEQGAQGAMLVDAKVNPTVAAEWLTEAFKGH